MTKATALLRVLHMAALGVAVLGFSLAVRVWFSSHYSAGAPEPRELANLGGLFFGLALGVVLLWRSLRLKATTVKTTIALYTAWVAVFAWYWFNRFSITELHSLDPEKIGREQVQQTAISIGIFLLWLALYTIGPVLMARRLRH